MMKYLKSMFSNEMSIIFLIFAYINVESTPASFCIAFIWVVTILAIFQSLSKNYMIYFRNEEALIMISRHVKKNEVQYHSTFFKLFSFFMFLTPLILNPILTFIYLDFLTLSIIWGILLLEGLNYYFYMKKIKKEFLNGEKNV